MQRTMMMAAGLAVMLTATGALAQTNPQKTKTETKEAGSAIKEAGKDVGEAAAAAGRTVADVAKGVAKGTVEAGKAMKNAVANELSNEERDGGWTLLFNGTSLDGWRGYTSEQPPAGWSVVDGVLARVGQGGDLMTSRQYGDFVLDLDYKISKGGNSGIMYRVTTEGERPYWSGPEFQLLDNDGHRDAKNGRDRLTGANYALHPPTTDPANPPGQWNNARIVVSGDDVEHWINGTKVVEYELGSPEWQKLVAASKFNAWPMYGKASRGYIVLQDHGDHVEFRNIKIKEQRR